MYYVNTINNIFFTNDQSIDFLKSQYVFLKVSGKCFYDLISLTS